MSRHDVELALHNTKLLRYDSLQSLSSSAIVRLIVRPAKASPVTISGRICRVRFTNPMIANRPRRLIQPCLAPASLKQQIVRKCVNGRQTFYEAPERDAHSEPLSDRLGGLKQQQRVKPHLNKIVTVTNLRRRAAHQTSEAFSKAGL
ncbi:MAG TPA: hypothetical protein VKJ45_19425, partial [Blastocatellia bacterium]|nr:hypothetical protein [Blastocatellia bacterium]